MKIVIIILITILSLNVYSQTIGVQPHVFKYKGSNTLLLNHPDFRSDKFTLGWHWAYGRSMTKALNFNSIHYAIDDKMRPMPHYRTAIELDSIADSCHVIMNSSIVGNHWSAYSPAFSLSYQYEPTLLIDPNNPLAFNPRVNDTTRSIFGFSNIRGYIPTSSSDPNYNRLIIRDSLNGLTILKNNWPNDYLKHFLNSICHYNITFTLENNLLTTL